MMILSVCNANLTRLDVKRQNRPIARSAAAQPTHALVRRHAPGDYNPETTQPNMTGRTARPRTCPVPLRSWQAAAEASGLVELVGRLRRPLRRILRPPLLFESSSTAVSVAARRRQPSPESSQVLSTRPDR